MKRRHEEPHVLRGYIYLKGNLVYAECIDLCIMVARPTFDEARKALDDAVTGTLDAAAEQGMLDEVLRRKSPWNRRLLYYLALLRTKLRPWRPGGSVGIRPEVIECVKSCPTHA